MNKKQVGNLLLALVSTSVPLIRGIGENMVSTGLLSAIFNFGFTLCLWNLIPDEYWIRINKPLSIDRLKILALPFLIVYLIIILVSFDLIVLLFD